MQLLQQVMLTDFIPRLYQERIFGTASLKNTLVVLPTGLGKTALAMMLAAHRLTVYPDSKIVFLAPTKPLVEQHKKSFDTHLQFDKEKSFVFTGEIPPKKRQELWQQGQVFFSTPQGFENDVMGNKITLKNVSLIIFDEAHHAIGDYAYVFLAQQFEKQAEHPRMIALTASPGSEIEKIQEVCENLYIEAVEIRTEEDHDVKPYVQEKKIHTISVPLPTSFKAIKNYLTECVKTKLEEVQKLGRLKNGNLATKKELLSIQRELIQELSSGMRDYDAMRAVSLVAEAMKANHALELLETQGITPLHNYCERAFKDAPHSKTKALKNLVQDYNFKSAFIKTQELVNKGVEHPKLDHLKKAINTILSKNPFGKCIVFTQYRDSALMIKDAITSEKVLPKIFVGQAKKRNTGLSQKQQLAMLDEFRDGLFNTLIATSVAEEGLDIPQVDAVIFYEPIPSAIRAIQRSGRTARHKEGSIIVLSAKGTRDEGYRWSAIHKERRMKRFLNDLKNKLVFSKPSQPILKDYDRKKSVLMYADYREKGSAVLKELLTKPVELRLESLQSADIVLSSRVGVELKKQQDFVDSILDGRLVLQVKELRKNFERPLIIIEGDNDLYTLRNIHPNAIRGMIAMITISYGIPLLYTTNPQETASLLYTIGEREQNDKSKEFTFHFEKRNLSEKELQEYIVSSLPSVGASVAKDLLQHFKTVKDIINASEEELQQVLGVGKKIARRIKEIVDKDYS